MKLFFNVAINNIEICNIFDNTIVHVHIMKLIEDNEDFGGKFKKKMSFNMLLKNSYKKEMIQYIINFYENALKTDMNNFCYRCANRRDPGSRLRHVRRSGQQGAPEHRAGGHRCRRGRRHACRECRIPRRNPGHPLRGVHRRGIRHHDRGAPPGGPRECRRRSTSSAPPWQVTQLGARAEYSFRPSAPRDGAQAAAADDFELQQYLHLHALNRGILSPRSTTWR